LNDASVTKKAGLPGWLMFRVIGREAHPYP
jgi:hypothetical protein